MTRINKLLQLSLVPLIFKIVSLLFFIGLVLIGFSATANNTALLKELRNTNWANLLVWSYWWPLIIICAVFFGRVWCFVCPVETLTSLAAKVGLKKKAPRLFASGWVMTILYSIILFIGIHGLAIHRDPSRMALYLVLLASLSILTGLVFEKNAFCAYLCPVGHLLGLYAKLSPFGWRVKNHNICTSCKDKSCIHKKNRYNVITKSCGVGLYPATIVSNADCILCTGCLKACGKFNSAEHSDRPNPGFRFLGLQHMFRESWRATPAVVVFILIISGFVIYEILSEWPVTENMLMLVPTVSKNYFSIANPIVFGVIKSSILFVLLPLLLTLIPYLISPLARTEMEFMEYLKSYLPSLVPIMAALHIGKSLLKMSSRVPYFAVIGPDPSGVSMAEQIVKKAIVLQVMPLWIDRTITFFLLLFLFAGISVALVMVYKENQRRFAGPQPTSLFILPILYVGIFFVMLFFWRIW